MIDLKVYNSLSPAKGRVLITEPFLEDDYFERSIILLCEHNAEGSFGFVLNNYTDLKLEEIVEFPDFDTKISTGGPVSEKHLYFIHTLGHDILDSVKVTDEIFLGGDFEQVKSKIKDGLIEPGQIRFFIGYSGWMKNQLDGELKQNSWLVSDILDVKKLMDVNYDTIWEDYMKNQGGKYKAFAQFPTNHKLN